MGVWRPRSGQFVPSNSRDDILPPRRSQRRPRTTALASTVALVSTLLATGATGLLVKPAAAAAGSTTFAFTGGPQSFTVPTGVTGLKRVVVTVEPCHGPFLGTPDSQGRRYCSRDQRYHFVVAEHGESSG